MTNPDFTDHWKEYWEQRFDTRDFRNLRRAAQDPVHRWIVADVRHFEDDIGIDLSVLRESPEAVLDDARRGFSKFVSEEDIEDAAGDDYDLLPFHLVGINRLDFHHFRFSGFVSDVNTVTQLSVANIESEPVIEFGAAVIRFTCPDGHQTRIRQPLYETRSIEVCGHEDCRNSAHIDSTGTRARRVVEFSVVHEDTEISCVAAGRYADTEYRFLDMNPGNDVLLTGIPRLVTDIDGSLNPVYEVLHVEPT